MRKKFSKVYAAAIVVAMAITSVPVFAATNYSWSGYAQTPGTSISTDARTKNTSSSVIANYSSGSSDFVGVTVSAKVGSSWVNCTYYNNSHPIYYAYKGTSNYIDVLNTVSESYGTPRSVRANFTATSAGSHSGKWRPDV